MKTLSELFTAFSNERTCYQDPDIRATIDRLQSAAEAVVYKENEIGGEARRVVANVARVLDVDIDYGPGHRWDADHMHRVVIGAEAVKASVASTKAAHETVWKLHQERGTRIFELQGELGALRDELAALREAYSARIGRHIETYTERDELKATIVSQAREIARLKGESA